MHGDHAGHRCKLRDDAARGRTNAASPVAPHWHSACGSCSIAQARDDVYAGTQIIRARGKPTSAAGAPIHRATAASTSRTGASLATASAAPGAVVAAARVAHCAVRSRRARAGFFRCLTSPRIRRLISAAPRPFSGFWKWLRSAAQGVLLQRPGRLALFLLCADQALGVSFSIKSAVSRNRSSRKRGQGMFSTSQRGLRATNRRLGSPRTVLPMR